MSYWRIERRGTSSDILDCDFVTLKSLWRNYLQATSEIGTRRSSAGDPVPVGGLAPELSTTRQHHQRLRSITTPNEGKHARLRNSSSRHQTNSDTLKYVRLP